MTRLSNQSIILANPPSTEVDLDYNSPTSTFKLVSSDFATSSLNPKEIAVKTLYLSNDPTQRGWIQKDQDPSEGYMPAVLKGDPVTSAGLAEIISVGSEIKDYKKGDVILGFITWSKFSIISTDQIQSKVDTELGFPLHYYLTLFGVSSLTAWFGLSSVGEVKETDTIVVTAASGATGSMVVQLAKNCFNCAKVIAITSSEQKCNFVKSIGADISLNYKDSDFLEQLRKATGPTGTNLLFDNVGGKILDEVLTTMSLNGRVVPCGSISTYNDRSKGFIGNWHYITWKRLTVKGFVLTDFLPRVGEAIGYISGALKEGKVKYEEGKSFTIADCTGNKFIDVPSVWHTLFESKKGSGKLITLVSKYEKH